MTNYESTINAAPPSGTVGVEVRRLIESHELYSLLTDVSNGIDSPATCAIASRLVCQLDRAREALAQQLAVVDEVISAARAVAKEYDGPLEAVIYDNDDDVVGDRVCCLVRSYEPHAEGCPLIRLRTALTAAQQPAGVDEAMVEGLKQLVRYLAGNSNFDFDAALADLAAHQQGGA